MNLEYKYASEHNSTKRLGQQHSAGGRKSNMSVTGGRSDGRPTTSDYMKRNDTAMSTSKGRRNQMNANDTPSVWDPVPLRSLYHVKSGMITFNPMSDPNPDVQVNR